MDGWSIEHGDVTDVVGCMDDNCCDGVLCDPPYGISFMGRKWDYDIPGPEVWRAVLRVLKPGAPLIAFGGARTYHRIACAIEDAGFEIRDSLMWLYGRGFPKSQATDKAIDTHLGAERVAVGTRTLTGSAALSTAEKGGTYASGTSSHGRTKDVPVTAPGSPEAAPWQGYGTALKPAFEPAVLARKPLEGTMAENVLRWGVGPLAIDACRVGESGGTRTQSGGQAPVRTAYGEFAKTQRVDQIDAWRWPANLLLEDQEILGENSRFFYSPKVSKKEREKGTEALPLRTPSEIHGRKEGSAGLANPRAGAASTGAVRNHHPTLKPIALCEYLARLILPPRPGTLLVPFSGAGSEVIGARLAGWPTVIGIEREAEYVEIARARAAAWDTAFADREDKQLRIW